MPEVLKIDSNGNPRSYLQEAARIINNGGVIAYPTDTFYGLGADPFNEEAIRKIFKIKGREETKPLLLLIAQKKEVACLTKGINPVAKELMARFWPGPLTMILEASDALPPLLLGYSGKVGLRLPKSKMLSRLIGLVGRPITASSANKSGGENPLCVAEILNSFGEGLELIIDGGTSATTVASTVIDVSVVPPFLIREGVIAFSEIEKVLNDLL